MSQQEENKFVDPRYARGTGYGDVLKDIQNQQVCPFCPDTFKWHTNPILKEEEGWIITRNFKPYPGTREHFIILGKSHKDQLAQVTPDDMAALLFLAQWVTAEFHLPGGLLAMRFGDSEYTGATVTHLHAHLLVPDKINGTVQVVNFPVG